MYSKLPNLVIGFHGCDQTVFERAIRDGGPIKSMTGWSMEFIFLRRTIKECWSWRRKVRKQKTAVIEAVSQQIHDFNREEKHAVSDLVRGIFVEGGPPHPRAEFRKKAYVQLCIVKPNCIKGFLKPLIENKNFVMP